MNLFLFYVICGLCTVLKQNRTQNPKTNGAVHNTSYHTHRYLWYVCLTLEVIVSANFRTTLFAVEPSR